MVRITTLVENKKGEHLGLQEEHGLSFLVEIDDKKIIPKSFSASFRYFSLLVISPNW